MQCRVVWALFCGVLLPLRVWSTMLAARVPVLVNLRRVAPAPTNSTLASGQRQYVEARDKEVRSKPELFQNVLGVVPGAPFQFDLSKWRLLQACGLFSNLIAKTVSRDGELVMIVSGDELPAIQFAPEVALGAKTIEKPEVSGNLLFRDNNFRGTGDRIELMYSAFSKGIEDRGLTGELPPSIRFKWIDGIRGRPNSASFSLEEDHVMEDGFNAVPSALGLKLSSLKRKVQLAVVKASLTLQGTRNPPQSQSSTLGQVKYELEPYNIEIFSDSSPNLRLSGAKFKVSTKLTSSLPISNVEVTCDHGVFKSKKTKAKYSQAGVDLTSNEAHLFSIRNSTQKNEELYRVVGQAKLRFMKSWGSGCLPFYHHAPIEDPQYIRGYSNSGAFYPRAPRYSILKLDAFLQGSSLGTPGIFIDAGTFNGLLKPVHVEQEKRGWSLFGASSSSSSSSDTQNVAPEKQVTLGLSLKSHGLRLDVGWPCPSKSLTPRFYLSVDV